jgi:hypothetical protein
MVRRLVGERRALAAAVLGFYTFLYALLALNPPDGWAACIGGLTGVYGLGFFGVVAGYFWARWYAMGLALSGLITGGILMWQIGLDPLAIFWAGTHALAWVMLWGEGPASVFDGRTEWRTRFHMDENATHKLGRSVIRLGVSLPYVVMYALAPRQGGSGLAEVLALGLVAAGVWGIVTMRTWGLAAVAAAAAVIVADLVTGTTALSATLGGAVALQLVATGAVAALLLGAVVAPFVVPAIRRLRAR